MLSPTQRKIVPSVCYEKILIAWKKQNSKFANTHTMDGLEPDQYREAVEQFLENVVW